jgi:hypothetical protein
MREIGGIRHILRFKADAGKLPGSIDYHRGLVGTYPHSKTRLWRIQACGLRGGIGYHKRRVEVEAAYFPFPSEIVAGTIYGQYIPRGQQIGFGFKVCLAV